MSFSPQSLRKRTLSKLKQASCQLLVLGVFLQGVVLCQVQNPKPANAALLSAAYDLNIDNAKQALQNGADVNATDQFGRTALIIVSGNNFDVFQGPRASEELARLLLKSGANPNIKLSGDPVGIGATPLLGAIKFDQLSIAKLLLDNGADPNLADSRGRTPICMAAYRQNIESINLLLERGVVLNQNAAASCNPVKSCMETANASQDHAGVKNCLSRLIEAKADPNLPGTVFTPLMEAALYGYVDLVEFLLKNGARVDAQGADGATPLTQAQKPEISEILLRHGADVNHRNKLGQTPLMFAESPEVAMVLLQHGARINDVDNEGFTALAYATSRLKPGLVKTLLQNKSSVTLKTSSGMTLFHVIFDQLQQRPVTDAEFQELAELFIKAGLRPNEKDNSGTYPIHLAANWGSAAAIQMMVRNGADLLVKDEDGKTPLQIAKQAERGQAARLIEDLLAKNSSSLTGNPPKSFWNQFAVPLIDGRPALASADPDPIRQGQLEDFSYDLLKSGFSDTDGDLLLFWERMSEAAREALRREHKAVFASYDPLRTFFPDHRYELDEKSIATANRLLIRLNKQTKPTDPNNPFDALGLNDGPLTALSAAHMVASVPKSLGIKPEVMKREALQSFLFGTFSRLYGTPADSAKVVGFDEARQYFDARVKSIGGNIIRLYQGQRTLLRDTFKRPMPPMTLNFELSRSRTSSSLDTSGAVPKRYASLSYEDVVDSFHACITDGLAPIIESDDPEDEEYLGALFGSLPKEMQNVGLSSETSNSDPDPISREEAIENLQSIRTRLSEAQPISLQTIGGSGPIGKFFSDLLLGFARTRPQKKDLPVFMKSFERRLKAMERRHAENEDAMDNELATVERALTEFAVNAYLYDASRKVETQFNNVLEFALAHELGHHVFGTVEMHNVNAEDDADAFAVTLLTGAYAHLSLTDLQVMDSTHPENKTGTKLVVLDGNTLRNYIGYPIYFGSRLKQSETHSPLTSNYRAPDERVKLLTDQFRSVYRVLQTKIFADRMRTYQGRQASRNVLDEFTSVVTLAGERQPVK